MIQEVPVHRAVVGIVAALGDELVEVVEALVVAQVEDDAPVLIDDAGRAFVLEATERRALDRGRVRVVGIVLDDPAETVRLVGLLAEVEARDRLVPGIAPLRLDAVTPVVSRLRRVSRVAAGEVAVEILLGHERRAPGSLAAGAIVDRAEDTGPGRVVAGLHPVVTGGRAGDPHLGVQRDAPRVLAVFDHAPFAAFHLDLNDRAVVGHHLDPRLLRRLRIPAEVGEHKLWVGVLVVGMNKPVLGVVRAQRQRHVGEEIAVVAELLCLGLGANPDFSNPLMHRGGESRKMAIRQSLTAIPERPRCKQSVAQHCSNLNRLNGTRLWPGSMAESPL